jgi:hypothetical protein
VIELGTTEHKKYAKGKNSFEFSVNQITIKKKIIQIKMLF